MKIFFFEYQMKKKNSLSDSADFERGALIKVQDSECNWGVSDLKPWPRLGDPTLLRELENRGALFQRSLFLAQEDLTARKNKVSLLQDKFIHNNWLITDVKKIDVKNNFSGTIKIKSLGFSLVELVQGLKNLTQKNLKIRLDFNGSLKANDFEHFISHLPNSVLERIEYIEDPLPEINSSWIKWNQKIPLAVDFAKGDIFSNENMWSYLIIKPSRQDSKMLIAKCKDLNKKVTLTSAMDHPVGLAHGLRYAQHRPYHEAGFLTLDLYEDTDFNKYFTFDQNKINFSEQALNDYGIGMTKSLENLNWVEL